METHIIIRFFCYKQPFRQNIYNLVDEEVKKSWYNILYARPHIWNDFSLTLWPCSLQFVVDILVRSFVRIRVEIEVVPRGEPLDAGCSNSTSSAQSPHPLLAKLTQNKNSTGQKIPFLPSTRFRHFILRHMVGPKFLIYSPFEWNFLPWILNEFGFFIYMLENE